MKAKTIKTLVLFLTVALVCITCKKEPQPTPAPTPAPQPTITLKATEKTVGSKGGSDEISYTIANAVDGTKASVKSDASWIKIGDTSNSSCKFTYEENKTTTARKAVLTVSYGKAKSVTCTVTQEAAAAPDPVIKPATTEISVGNTAGNGTFAVTVDNPTATDKLTATSSADWLTLEVSASNGYSVKYTYTANSATTARTATVTLKYGKAAAQTVKVTQAAATPDPVITPATTEISVGNTAGNGTFAVTVDNPTATDKLTATSSADWLTLEVTSTNGYAVKYTYTANSTTTARTATVTLKYGKAAEKTVKVTQTAADPDPVITPATTEISVGNTAGNGAFAVTVDNPTADGKLTATSNADWLTLEVTSANGYAVKYTYTANSTTTARTATVTLKYGKAAEKTVKVTQAAANPDPVIKPATTEISVGNTAGNGSFAVTVDYPTATDKLTATSSADWLTLEVTSTNGYAVKYTYTANSATTARTATVTLKYGKAAEKTVKVTQTASTPDPVITPATTEISLGNTAGNGAFAVTVDNPTATDKLTATSSADWLTLEVSASNGYSVKYTYTANSATTARTATVTLKYGKASEKTVKVTQAAATPDPVIKPATTEISVGNTAGNGVFAVTVDNPTATDKLTATSSADWLTLEVSASNGYSVKYTYTANSATTARTATVTLKYGKAAEKTVKVTQAAATPDPVITPAMTDISVTESAGSGAFAVTVDNPTASDNLTATSDANWLTLEVTSNNGYAVKYTYTANDATTSRTATITLKYGKAAEKTVKVTQDAAAAPVIVLTDASAELTGDAGSYTAQLSITNPRSGKTATAKSNATWLTVDSVSNTEIKYSVTENSGSEARKGAITVSYEGAENQVFNVTQNFKPKSPVIKVKTTSVNVSCAEQEISLECTIENPTGANVDFSYDGAEWANPIYFDNTLLQFKLDANTSGSERSFNMTWKYPGAQDVTVTVTQNAMDAKIQVASENVVINKLGEAVEVTYSLVNAPSELEYFTFDTPSWLHASYNGMAQNFRFYADENKGDVRTGEVTIHAWFKGGFEATKKINVAQNNQELTLKLDPTSSSVNYTAGTLKIAVTLATSASGSVQFSSSAPWVKLYNCDASSLTMQYIANNSKAERTANITITYPNHAPATFTLTQKGNPNIPDNVIDLGLESGLLWAVSNVGASSATDAGDFFAWGETSKKSSYTWSNYAFGTEDKLTKYTGDSFKLGSDDDVASKTLGAGWRMPTETDWLELEDICDIAEAVEGGVSGLKITSTKTGQSIFLPYTGYKEDSAVKDAKSCYLWSKTRPHKYTNDQKNGWSFYGEGCSAMPRCLGMPVRAVYDPNN